MEVIGTGMFRSIVDWGSGKNIYDQLALHFPIVYQFPSYYVIKCWLIYDQFFVKIYEKDDFCWSINQVVQNGILIILRLLIDNFTDQVISRFDRMIIFLSRNINFTKN